MECTRACTTEGALRLNAGGGPRKAPAWMVPALLAGITALGLTGGSLISIPSYTRAYDSVSPASPRVRTVVMTVDGLRCVDTAARAASQLEGLPGVLHFTAYASQGRAEIDFDETLIDAAALRRAIEGPLYDRESDQYLFHQFTVLEIDGKKIDE